jgi:peptide subunit release factor 1 (eRF1)
MPLHRAVEDEAAVGPTPRLVQLAGMLADDPRLLMVLVDRQNAKCYRWELGELKQRATRFDEVPRAVDTDVELGGFDRRHADELRHHVRAVADMVVDELRDWTPHEVVIGGSAQAASALVDVLPDDIGRIANRVTLDVHAADVDIARVAEVISAGIVRREEDAMVDALSTRVAADRGVIGLDDTLAALADERVETLILARHLQSSGSRCPACGRRSAHTVRCALRSRHRRHR